MEEQSPEVLLKKYLHEWKERLAQEVGTEPACPLCKQPRVARSDYIRCRNCGVNWLDEEMHLPGYLDRNPSAARAEAARTTTATKPTATTSAEAAKE